MLGWMKRLLIWWKCDGCGQRHGPRDLAHEVGYRDGRVEFYCVECCNENG